MMLIWLPWQSRGAGVSCAGGAGRNGQSGAVTELPLLFLYVQPKAKPTQPLCQNSFTKCRQMTVAKTNANIHHGIWLFRQWISSDILTFLDEVGQTGGERIARTGARYNRVD